MKIIYPISDNTGNNCLILIEEFQNLPDGITESLGDIKILDITLERVSGEGYFNLGTLSKISTCIAEVLMDNDNVILYFYCDDIHDVKRRDTTISPQKFRNDLFSAMFKRYVQANPTKSIVDTTITAQADRDIYIHLIAKQKHKKHVDVIRENINMLSQK